MEIKNALFDLGGVIVDINPNLTIEAFRHLGYYYIEEIYQQWLADGTLEAFDKGEIEESQFFESIQNLEENAFPIETLKQCWNSTILQIPAERLLLLDKIKKEYHSISISNTNCTHIEFINQYLQKEHQRDDIQSHFHANYFSYQHQLIKPSKDFLDKIIYEQNIKPEETVYLDDNEDNIHIAEKMGFIVEWIHPENQMVDLFE